MNHRYSRHIALSEIGIEGQQKLTNARVLVVGAGGLGCPILQYLTAAGIGKIGIIDFDKIEISNLQRQILFDEKTIGENKALIAKKKLERLNGSIEIKAYPEQLTYQNAINYFKEYDIIVDGTDNFETRYLINDAAILTDKPLVYGAIYKFEGQVAVFNYKGGPSYRCLFPSPPKGEAIPNCNDLGVLGVLPGIIGTMQANEVLKIILGFGTVLSGKLLCYDALQMQIHTMILQKSITEINKIKSKREEFSRNKFSNELCNKNAPTIHIKEALLRNNIQLIDVRESHEMPFIKGDNILNISLKELKENLSKIQANKEVMIFCQSGYRSKKAVEILNKEGIYNCWSIEESAIEIANVLADNKLEINNKIDEKI